MTTPTRDSNLDDVPMDFTDPAEPAAIPQAAVPWKILVVDDEEDVHRVTRLALSGMTIHGRGLELMSAYSGSESVDLMHRHQDIAIVLMDVVMETEHAGLEAVQAIRNELGNKFVRIILRTGQPGQAPERMVIERFDINDYKEKTELTAKKLYTVIHTSLSHYRELVAMHKSRLGLRKVIDATASIFEERSRESFAQGVLEQLAAIVYASPHAMLVRASGIAATRGDGDPARIIAGTGRYHETAGRSAEDVMEADVMETIRSTLAARRNSYGEKHFAGYFETRTGSQNVLYLTSEGPFADADRDMIELFCRNVAIGLENLHLWAEAERTQREMILTLCDAVETRSRETGNHVRRVAESCRLLGELSGLGEKDCETLFLASPLHDIGKIAVPDHILHKSGKLDAEEWRVMQAHARIGAELFAKSPRPTLRAAGIIAGQHHERWDGQGYPERVSGEAIHIFARITTLADVFDALASRRCYKESWTEEQVMRYLVEQAGRQFDPQLVRLFVENADRFWRIRAELPDPPVHDHLHAPAAGAGAVVTH